MGMIEMIAMIVGSSSTAAAWTVHLVVSAVIGAGVWRRGQPGHVGADGVGAVSSTLPSGGSWARYC